jgi:hypothetical protein
LRFGRVRPDSGGVLTPALTPSASRTIVRGMLLPKDVIRAAKGLPPETRDAQEESPRAPDKESRGVLRSGRALSAREDECRHEGQRTVASSPPDRNEKDFVVAAVSGDALEFSKHDGAGELPRIAGASLRSLPRRLARAQVANLLVVRGSQRMSGKHAVDYLIERFQPWRGWSAFDALVGRDAYLWWYAVTLEPYYSVRPSQLGQIGCSDDAGPGAALEERIAQNLEAIRKRDTVLEERYIPAEGAVVVCEAHFRCGTEAVALSDLRAKRAKWRIGGIAESLDLRVLAASRAKAEDFARQYVIRWRSARGRYTRTSGAPAPMTPATMTTTLLTNC